MNTADRQWELEKIEKVGQGILEDIDPSIDCGGVNWGDLSIVEARFVTTTEDAFYEVVIEKVSPEARAFASKVEEVYADRGFDVRVITEW